MVRKNIGFLLFIQEKRRKNNMKLYDTVKLTEKFAEFDAGTVGVIIELYDNKVLLEEVKMFYKKNFWDRMRLDEITDQHKANEMFVFGVNAGCGRSVRLAQLVVGTVADGLIGPNTIAAINSYDVDEFDREFDEEEIKYYEAIVRNNPEKKIFLNGWKNRAKAV